MQEIRRIAIRLARKRIQPARIIAWSCWRRAHQAAAQRAHFKSKSNCNARTGKLFSYVDLEARVRRDHPLRAIRSIVNEALLALEREFAGLYSPIGRPSIPREKLLQAMLLQAFYSIRSERLLMERLEYDLLFRWFVGIWRRRRGLGLFGVLEEPTGCWKATSRPSSWRWCWRSPK